MAMKLSELRFSYNSIISYLFLLSICMPGILMTVQTGKTISQIEKRNLARFPDLTWDYPSIKSFPEKFELYIKDHFGFRDWLIYTNNRIKYRWLQKSPNPQVAIGKDGWLFYQTDTFGISLSDDFRGLIKLSELQLEGMKRNLETKRDWLAKRGIHYIYIAVPNKQTVYPEYFPEHFKVVVRKTQLDQFLEYMKQNSDLQILDLRAVLINEKNQDRIYYKTDSHWNDRGAFIAYQRIIDRIKTASVKINSSIPESNLEIEERSESGRDLAKLIGLPDLTEFNVPSYSLKNSSFNKNDNPKWAVTSWPWWFQPFETTNQEAEAKSIVFRDSFFDALLPFFAQHFRHAAYIASKFDYSVMEDLIKKIKPDIVIEEGIERHTFLAFLPEAIFATMGNDLLIRGETGAAIEYFKKAAAVKPNDPDSYCNLGFAFLKARQFFKAVEMFKHALHLDPNHIKSSENLRITHGIIQKLNTEIAALEKKCLSNPDDVSLLKKLGRVYHRRGETEKALGCFFKVLMIDDSEIDAMNDIALIYTQEKKYGDAITFFNKILAIAPNRADVFYNLACVYSIQNKLEQAVTALQKAIENGYHDYNRLRFDYDLQNVRHTAFFKKLVSADLKTP